MKELNHPTLQAALVRLPHYEPPVGVWESLDAALALDAALGDSAQQLPTYAPPTAVWENIAAQLPTARPVARRVNLWTRYAVAAAVAAALFGAWWLLRPMTDMNASEQIVVTQETMNQQVVAAVQENEDDAFQWVENLCASRAPVCEEPEFKTLKSELDELTAAKQNLHTALGQYGDDPDLTTQLVQIELARTQLLQEMMQMM